MANRLYVGVKFHWFKLSIKCEEDLQCVVVARRWRSAEQRKKDFLRIIKDIVLRVIEVFLTSYRTDDRQIDDINLWKREGMAVTSFHAK